MSSDDHSKQCTSKDLGILNVNPKFPEYASVNARRNSFEKWPADNPASVDDLVNAGLVYTGERDNVRCFYCGGGLKNWQQGDEPMVEHARWFPTCPHVILTKGAQFIKDVAEEEAEYDATAKAPDIAMDTQTEGSGRENLTRQTKDSVLDDCSDAGLLKEENERMKEMITCKICLDRVADICFLTCGHIVACGWCAPTSNSCLVCEALITGLLKTYGPNLSC